MARTIGTRSLQDLLRAGRLETGERLVIVRRNAPDIAAVLQGDGTIRLGRETFASPTGAAKEALNVGSIDGWIRWRVPRLGGRSLADVRNEQ